MYQQLPLNPQLAAGVYSGLTAHQVGAMDSRRARQVNQANALAVNQANAMAINQANAMAINQAQHAMTPQIAAGQINELQGYLARCAQGGGYAANPWTGDTQASGIGSPKSNCLIRADLGSVKGMAIDQKTYGQISVTAAAVVSVPNPIAGQVFASTGAGSFTLQLALSSEDQASFNGKIITNVGVATSPSGDFPDGFDSGQLENFIIKRSKLKVLTGGTENVQTDATLAWLAIVYSAQFPKSGAELGIRNMSGVWNATKFLWVGSNFPPAPAPLTYEVDSDVILTYGLEQAGMHSC